MTDYQDCKTRLDTRGDRRYCGVIAFSILSKLDVLEARTILERLGRPRCGGTSRYTMELAIESQGLKHEILVEDGKNPKTNRKVRGWKASKTVRTLQKCVPKRGTFLVNTARHVLVIKNGVVHDWTDGRLNRIQRIVKIS